MNKLDLAQTLIAIADCGSITKAADHLHQTTAAISKKLTKLEAHLSVQLLLRQGREFGLTEAGQRYYAEMKKVIAQFELAERSVEQKSQLPRGSLKVVANEYYANTKIMPKLAQFLKKFPDLNLTLETAEILPNFKAKKMDILFGISNAGADNLVRKRIDTTNYVICAAPNYFKVKSAPKSISELLQYDFISHSARQTPDLIRFDEGSDLLMSAKCYFNHSNLMIDAAVRGLGFIWTHENLVADLLKKKKLIPILKKHTRKSIPIYVYYEQKPQIDLKIKAFMEFFTN